MMIRINLLPEEYRKSERSSPKVFVATLAGVVAVCAAFGWFGFVYFGELANLEVQYRSVEEEMVSTKKRASYYDALVKEKQEYKKRSETIQNIGRSRLIWTQVLDQLLDVVNNDGDTERHLAWFKSMQVRDGDGRKKGPSVTMPGWVQGSNIQKVADFHEDLENAPFFVDVMEKTPPSGVVDIDEKRTPPEALFFNLKWTFRPHKQWVKNRSAKKKK